MAYITKKKIAQAFHDVVLVRGFSRTSVTAIMSTADFRRQTFYDYFQDKDKPLSCYRDRVLLHRILEKLFVLLIY